MVAAVAEAPPLEAEEEGGQAHHHRCGQVRWAPQGLRGGEGGGPPRVSPTHAEACLG